LVNELHNDIRLNSKIYEYLEKDESHVYHVDFKNADAKLEFDSYVLTMATFTGDLDL
jgi:hypothetical protein